MVEPAPKRTAGTEALPAELTERPVKLRVGQDAPPIIKSNILSPPEVRPLLVSVEKLYEGTAAEPQGACICPPNLEAVVEVAVKYSATTDRKSTRLNSSH